MLVGAVRFQFDNNIERSVIVIELSQFISAGFEHAVPVIVGVGVLVGVGVGVLVGVGVGVLVGVGVSEACTVGVGEFVGVGVRVVGVGVNVAVGTVVGTPDVVGDQILKSFAIHPKPQSYQS